MKQLTAANQKVTAIYRFHNRKVYIKVNSLNQQYSAKIIAQLKSKGANILVGRNWIEADLIMDNVILKLGELEVDIEKMPIEEIDITLCKFFKTILLKGGFQVKEEDI